MANENPVNIINTVVGGATLAGGAIRYERLRLAQQDVRDAQIDLNDARKASDAYTDAVSSGIAAFDPGKAMRLQKDVNDFTYAWIQSQRDYDSIESEGALWMAAQGAGELASGMGYGWANASNPGAGGQFSMGGSMGEGFVPGLLLGGVAGVALDEMATSTRRRRAAA